MREDAGDLDIDESFVDALTSAIDFEGGQAPVNLLVQRHPDLRKYVGERKLLPLLQSLSKHFQCIPDAVHPGNWKVRLLSTSEGGSSVTKADQYEKLAVASDALCEELSFRLRAGGMPVAVMLTNGKVQRRIKNLVSIMEDNWARGQMQGDWRERWRTSMAVLLDFIAARPEQFALEGSGLELGSAKDMGEDQMRSTKVALAQPKTSGGSADDVKRDAESHASDELPASKKARHESQADGE